MRWITGKVLDFDSNRERIRTRRYGIIETTEGELRAITLRRFPTFLSLPEVWPCGERYHAAGEPDHCRLYYNQPLRMPNYLALRYVVSTQGTSYRTFRTALRALDAIAELKRIDAIVCDAANVRLSDRFMKRLGWEPLAERRFHRNFIRRFYGHYPNSDVLLAPQVVSNTPALLPQVAVGPPA